MPLTTGRRTASAAPWKVFCSHSVIESAIAGKTVAIVGSGPGSSKNKPGFVDSHDVVVRVNNYKTGPSAGTRTDIFYSFFGTSIRKTAGELKADGVKLCICKCPNAQVIDSPWHRRNGKMNGVDFRWIYKLRESFWFCDTYVPTVEEFLAHFHLLGSHVPTTGFSAILDVLRFNPARVYLTGFDFFQSGVHNVNEKWRPGREDDPIGHVPDGERAWLSENLSRLPISMDETLQRALRGEVKPMLVPSRPVVNRIVMNRRGMGRR